jgi:hypothetical protein
MILEHDDRKCVCCQRVYTHSFLMEFAPHVVPGKCGTEQHPVCTNCAKIIHDFYKKLVT